MRNVQSMHRYKGRCQCHAVEVLVELTQPLSSYSARKCDCDFCIQRHISYLSDPNGKLNICTNLELDIQKQGSDQAEFLTCPMCKDVISASIQIEDNRIGALNASLLDECSSLKTATIVSPQKLSAQEKLSRWQTFWTSVSITALTPP